MRMVSKWMFAVGTAVSLFGSIGVSHAQQTIRVGWTIPAEESKYWMMRRPQEFPDIGKTYNIEWTQFQGTAPMTQALAALRSRLAGSCMNAFMRLAKASVSRGST